MEPEARKSLTSVNTPGRLHRPVLLLSLTVTLATGVVTLIGLFVVSVREESAASGQAGGVRVRETSTRAAASGSATGPAATNDSLLAAVLSRVGRGSNRDGRSLTGRRGDRSGSGTRERMHGGLGLRSVEVARRSSSVVRSGAGKSVNTRGIGQRRCSLMPHCDVSNSAHAIGASEPLTGVAETGGVPSVDHIGVARTLLRGRLPALALRQLESVVLLLRSLSTTLSAAAATLGPAITVFGRTVAVGVFVCQENRRKRRKGVGRRLRVGLRTLIAISA